MNDPKGPRRTLRRPGEIKDPPKARPEPSRAEPSEERVAAFRFGLSAESRAAALLVAKGFRILARRWKSPVGEIDIVARRAGMLVFVEVKARADLEAAAESVSARQQRRIVAAAEAWFAVRPDDVGLDVRFDVILVAPGHVPRHLQGAFDASP